MGGTGYERRPAHGHRRRGAGLSAGFRVSPRGATRLLAREREAHAAAEADLRALLDLIMQLPAALTVTRGPRHVHELCNPLYRRIVGGRAIEGKAYVDAVPEIKTPGVPELLDHVYATGEPVIAREVPVELREPGGEPAQEAFYDGVLQPLRDASGAVNGVMLCAFEVTGQVLARRRAEQLAAENARLLESAERARAQAEKANRAKDAFLATVSHELRTPLAAVVGWTRMLRAGAVAEGRRERALEIIERNAAALQALVEELVESSRIAAGKLILQRRRAAVAPVVAVALEAVRPLAEAKGVRMDASLDLAAEADIDAGRIQQVTWNLVMNAVKFTPAGGALRVVVAAAGGAIEIVVEDSGQGVPADLLPLVFEPFRQGESDGRPQGGLGLGLAIVRHIVELHGGGITAESDGPGRGSRFTVRLPGAGAESRAQEPG